MADVQMSNGENGGESYLESLHIPAVVHKRVNALKNLQRQLLEIEAKFYEEIHQLECKYASMYEPLFLKREQIISGQYEPSEEETRWALDEEQAAEEGEQEASKEVGDLVKDLKAKVNLNSESDAAAEAAASIKGIPDFWLHTFKSTDLVSEMIQEYDEPVLKHLRDVRVRMHDQRPYGYTIEFHFTENEFFANKLLTKTYELSTEVDDKDPFAFDGPVLYKSTGCKIEWAKGKDVTVRLVKKKQKHKSSGVTRVVHKEEKQDSFFNYFDNPTETGMRPSDPRNNAVKADKDAPEAEAEAEVDVDDEKLCEADFEIGQFFKDFLIPKAVLYFTGELMDTASYDDDEYDDDDDDEEDEEGDEEDEDEAEEDVKKTQGKNGRGNAAAPQKRQNKGDGRPF